MTTADTNTPLLAAGALGISKKGKDEIQQKYDTYESKHGHIDTKKEHEKAEDITDYIEDKSLRLLILFFDKFSKIIISAYAMLCLLFAGAFVIGWLGLFGGRFVWFIVILSLTGFGSLLGAYGVYKYGTLKQYFDKFEHENKEYEEEMNKLEDQNKHLKKHVRGVVKTVQSLEHSADALEDTLEEYEKVLKEMWKLAGEHGSMQHIMDMINGINDVHEEMKKMAIRNAKSSLLSKYYDVQSRDGIPGLSKKEYKRFLSGLTVRSRTKFLKKGTFKDIAGKDGIICLDDFQNVVEEIIAECDEEILECARKAEETRSQTTIIND